MKKTILGIVTAAVFATGIGFTCDVFAASIDENSKPSRPAISKPVNKDSIGKADGFKREAVLPKKDIKRPVKPNMARPDNKQGLNHTPHQGLHKPQKHVGRPLPPHHVGRPVPHHRVGRPVPYQHRIGHPVPPHRVVRPLPPHRVVRPVPHHRVGRPVPYQHRVGRPLPPHRVVRPVPHHRVGHPVPYQHRVGRPLPPPHHRVGRPIHQGPKPHYGQHNSRPAVRNHYRPNAGKAKVHPSNNYKKIYKR